MMGKLNINKMSGLDPIRTETQHEVKNAGKDGGKGIEGKPSVSVDKLEISSRATEVGRLVEQLKAMPDVRQERVDALKQQIKEGKFAPSANEIANAILNDERS